MAREVKVSGRTVYLPDREEWELCDSPATPERVVEDIDRAWPGLVSSSPRRCGHCIHPAHVGMCTGRNGGTAHPCPCFHSSGGLESPPEPAPRAGPYALAVEVSGFVEHELLCSGCGEAATWNHGQFHFVPAPGGWRKCGEWR